MVQTRRFHVTRVRVYEVSIFWERPFHLQIMNMQFLLQPGPFHYLTGSLVAACASQPYVVKQGAADKKPLRLHV